MSSVTTKDYISLGISGVALALSVLTACFNFRHLDDAQVRIADFMVENKVGPEAGKDKVLTALAFINRGNQPVMVTGIETIAGPTPEPGGGWFGNPVSSVSESLPFVLDKGQLKLVKIATPLKDLIDNSQGSSHLYYGLQIASIDSRGEERGAKLVFAHLHLKGDKVASFKDEHSVTSLLGSAYVSFRVAD